LRKRGRENPKYYSFSSLCGKKVTSLGPRGASSFEYKCKSWNCVRNVCNIKLKEDYCFRIAVDFGQPLVHVFVARRAEKGQRLSNRIKRKVDGDYWWISSDTDTVIMSNRTFPGAVRLHRTKLMAFAGNEFDKKWSGEGRRVSCSRIFQHETKKGKKSGSYGLIHPDFAGPFYKLRTEIDQAHWLFHNNHRFIIKHKACDILLEKYRDYWPEWRRERQQADIDVEQAEEIDMLGDGDSGNSFMVDAKPLSWEQTNCDVSLIERLCILSIDGGITGAELSRVLAAAR
jgi:hypothetical protein